jgi:hypothetical protein
MWTPTSERWRLGEMVRLEGLDTGMKFPLMAMGVSEGFM